MEKSKQIESIRKTQKLIDTLKKKNQTGKYNITDSQLEMFESSVNQALLLKHEIKSIKVSLKRHNEQFDLEVDKIIDFYMEVKKRMKKSKKNKKDNSKSDKMIEDN